MLKIDTFRLCLMLGPVAIYVLLLGAINLSRRPFLVTGTRDAAALGLALSGAVIIGPIELFFPNAAAARFGPYVWLFLLAFFALCLVLVLLLLRPRLIIYNVQADRLRAILGDLASELDGGARWAGDSLMLPNLGVQLYVENLAVTRNVSLVAAGPNQNFLGWRRLESALSEILRGEEVSRNPRGWSLVCAGVLIGLALVMAVTRDPEAVAQALFNMLRLDR